MEAISEDHESDFRHVKLGKMNEMGNEIWVMSEWLRLGKKIRMGNKIHISI